VVTDVRVEWFYDGNVRSYVLPDGTSFREGSQKSHLLSTHEFVKNHYREKYGATQLRLTFHEVEPPPQRRAGRR
jgi:hypothetical protein